MTYRFRSGQAVEYLRTRVPGVVIPDKIVERLRKTPKGRKQEQGKRISIEIIQEVQDIKSVSDVHLMAQRQEESVPKSLMKSISCRGQCSPYLVIGIDGCGREDAGERTETVNSRVRSVNLAKKAHARPSSFSREKR